ncbi:hypothetical protein AHAS_Ahas03G0253500 [Arachis hypogaea]
MGPSKICLGSVLTQESKLLTNQRLNCKEFLVSTKIASVLYSSVQDHDVSNFMFENTTGRADSSNVHVSNQDNEVFVGSLAIVAADTDDDSPAVQVTAPVVMRRRFFH